MDIVHKQRSRLTPPRILSLGFATVIFVGSVLLWLPISHNPGYNMNYIDALFVSTSAVCVTGLTTVPIGYTLNVFGRIVLASLIQIGGWGVAIAAVLFSLFVGNKISLRSRQLLVDAMGFNGYTKVVQYIKYFVYISLSIEAVGAICSFFVFIQDYPFWPAVGYAIFHSISAFNNAGFDIFGGTDSMIMYANNIPINLITIALVILGGFGFLAMIDIWRCRKKGMRFWSLNTKVVFMMTCSLVIGGTILLKLTTDETWLESLFQSVIARTAGFGTYPLAKFSNAGILIFCLLMFIGASPGSTGGGIKTTTFFALILKAVSSTMHDNRDSIFYRKIPSLVFERALTVTVFGVTVVLLGVFFICWMQPQFDVKDVMVEVVSAFATVGSSCGITSQLCTLSKIVIISCMFIGRLGPVTIATLLVIKGPKDVRYTEESIMIG